MRSRMVKALLFVAILSVFAADITVGCGQGYVYGPVTQKLNTGMESGDHLIEVNGTAYDVPLVFFNQVHLGDIVKFDGRNWTIVKPGPTTVGGTTPTPTTP